MSTSKQVTGALTRKDNADYYKIENAQALPAFFINLAAASDIWCFMSSRGALTAGRQNAEGAVFPYETDDRLHLSAAGPMTVARLADGRVWEPFTVSFDNPYAFTRSLYKRLTGDAVIFEEVNETLGLTFSYKWETCERYGLVRTARIENHGGQPQSLRVLDGLDNIIPYGIAKGLAESSSCLTDAYKTAERPADGQGLAVFSLTSMIVDSPEPEEVSRANTAWYIGDAALFLLSARQVAAWAAGEAVSDETRAAGYKSAYLTSQRLTLAPGESKSWLFVLDAAQTHGQIAALRKELAETAPKALRARVMADVARGTAELTAIVAAADGLQCTADKKADTRHYMNVLYNNMRGGVFLDGYAYAPALFKEFVLSRNKALAEREAARLAALYACDNILDLHRRAYDCGCPDVTRLCLEFLPLTFSRRHGDPSRPWNRFNIALKDDRGGRLYRYEGNWRDIFQNWEAMVLSFPAYLAPIIAKFLNASTADGFNPYRITQAGIDWETPRPDDPFSGYGYWGDHQIVYLTKLLEWAAAYAPQALTELARQELFTYADVPYEIKPYASLLQDGKNTLVFNRERHERILRRAAENGADGKLLPDGAGVYHASFAEKLLVPVLAKLSNLVVGGGIWMNTQRPEWNDANNAIVGYGLSMVTVYQLYRHVGVLSQLLAGDGEARLSNETADWLAAVGQALAERARLSPRAFLDKAGTAFSAYRATVYRQGFSGKRPVPLSELRGFLTEARAALGETIQANKRADGLYHGYNLLTLTEDGLTVEPMFLMLEGQTAAVGSGCLPPGEAMAVAQAMEKSDLMSDEHHTFFLYPKKQLKPFMERNLIPEDAARPSALITALLADGQEGFVARDAQGHIRFHENIRRHADMEAALVALPPKYAAQAAAEKESLDALYESVFAHKRFTGRSGIMYKYEGIGSIYWHQNAKFMLSFQEMFDGGPAMKAMYYRLRDGLGFNKPPALWGAFPLEPYSHTPYGMPAQQPGMTGQVKEDILTRNAELGLTARAGRLCFNPALLRRSDFLTAPETFNGLTLTAGQLAFTVCGVDVVYTLADAPGLTAHLRGGERVTTAGELALDETLSRSVFDRDGSVTRIEVHITL